MTHPHRLFSVCSNTYFIHTPEPLAHRVKHSHTRAPCSQSKTFTHLSPLLTEQNIHTPEPLAHRVKHSHTRAPCSQSKTFTHLSPLLTEQNTHKPEPLAHRVKHSHTRAPCSQSKTFTHQSPLLTESKIQFPCMSCVNCAAHLLKPDAFFFAKASKKPC